MGGAVLAQGGEAARAKRHHALQGRARPQALALVDGQRRGVVDQQTPVLCERENNKRSDTKKENMRT